MLQKTRLLVLFDITKIEFADKETGENVVKFKYSFFDEENNLVVGYLDDEEYTDMLADTGEYNKAQAHGFEFTGREFNNEIKWRLLPQA